jgi:D-alanyl-D-alanine carboxypeptidase (penicillin-binding protein 5/6)
LPRGSFDNLTIENNIQSEIIGPIETGQILGKVVVKLNDSILATQPLIALKNNPKGTLWQQIKDTMQLWFE